MLVHLALLACIGFVQDDVDYEVEKGTGHCVLKLKLDKEPHAMAASPDGKTLAMGIKGDLYLVDFESGKLLKVVETDHGYIRGLAYAPDGKMVVAGAIGGIYAIDPATGKILWKADGHPSTNPRGRKEYSTYGVVFSADGKLVFTISMDGPNLRTWAASDGSEARVKDTKVKYLRKIARAGDTVIVDGDSALIAYDRDLNEIWRKRSRVMVGTLVPSPDGKTLALGTAGGGAGVSFLKTDSGDRARSGILADSRGTVSGVGFVAGGEGIVFATTKGKVAYRKGAEDPVVLDDDFEAGKDADKTLVVGLGGKMIAVAGDDDDARIYRIPE